MGADTDQIVEQIMKAGYYATGISLDLNTVVALNKFVADWHTYILKIDNDKTFSIVAKDDWTAIEAFKSSHDLDKCEYEIIKEVITQCCIAGSIKFCTVGKK